jgi:hypothetical protein
MIKDINYQSIKIKDINYQSIKNLSCGVLSIGNPTFQFAIKPHAFCQLEFTADLTSLCLIKGLDASPAYSFWSYLNVEKVNVVKHLNLQSCVEKYEFQSMTNEYTNPSYLAGLPLGKRTMSIVGGLTNKYTNPSYLAGLPLGKKTMSIAGGLANKYTNPSYLAGLPLGKKTMSIVGGLTNKYTNPSYFVDTMNLFSNYHRQAEQSYTDEFSCIFHEHLLPYLITKNDMCRTNETSDALINYCVGTFGREKSSKSKLHGGMYSANNNSNFPWNVLENKLALIGRVPYDCGSSPGDCFFASLAHGLYKNPDCHLDIRSAGITHLMHNPELYIESLANISWEHYIEEMSQPGTWCDNIIIQAVANALSCTIHITDSSPNANATIVNPISLQQRQKIVFLGYVTDIHYVSTLPNESAGNQTDSKRKEMLEKRRVYAKKRRSDETANAKKIRLDKVAEQKKSKRLVKLHRVSHNLNI